MNDDELKSALGKWKAPEPSPGIAERTWTEFEKRRRPLWVRAFEWRVSLPGPAAVLAGLLILALGALAGIALRPRSAPVAHEKVLTLAGFVPVKEIRPQIIRRN
ncbi:MAG: hypothetical protein ABSE42_11565 [Bryobacteraceae bacterium]|jgi:hypothetical protein